MTTTKQIEIALHIRAGACSIQRLMDSSGKGQSTIYSHLKRLRGKGLITWNPNKSRTLRLTDQGQAALADYCLIPGGGIGKVERV